MVKIVLNLLLPIALICCGAPQKTDQQETKTQSVAKSAILLNEISLVVSNDNPESIGYKVWETDEDEGAKSICIYEKSIYLTDVYHDNIKRIDIETGQVVSSQRIPRDPKHFDDKLWLRDIAFFDGSIYVTSDLGYVFVLDSSLKMTDRINIERGQPYFFSEKEEYLSVFINANQSEDLSIEVDLLIIRKGGNHKRVKEIIQVDEYKQRTTNYYTKGKIVNYDRGGHVKTDYWDVSLNEPIPKITKYDARNIDYTRNRLIYFNSTPEQLELKIYKIK